MREKCQSCERCTWNPGHDCGKPDHPYCKTCGHCRYRHEDQSAWKPAPLGPSTTKVLLAVMAEYRPTLQSVARRTGLARSTVKYHLVVLARNGLVSWAKGLSGTLHATVRTVQK